MFSHNAPYGTWLRGRMLKVIHQGAAPGEKCDVYNHLVLDDADDDDDVDAGTGSPFQFTVGPVKNGGAHKVVAVGDGLQSSNTSQPGILPALTTAAFFIVITRYPASEPARELVR